jgi:RNase P subunit RPR2
MYEKLSWEIKYIKSESKHREKSFLEDQIRWDEISKKEQINSAVMYRRRLCGDCKNHAPSDINHNSRSYTSCKITHNSITFGTACNCGKWMLRPELANF